LSVIKHLINLLIYLSATIGSFLLPQLYGVVPPWLFYSVFAGWVLYLGVAILAAAGQEIAYAAAFVLSIVTLLVSLPQPEHLSFVRTGFSLASLTFLIGDSVQIALVILVPIYLAQRRRKR